MKKVALITGLFFLTSNLFAFNASKSSVFDGFDIANGDYKIYGVNLCEKKILHPLLQNFYVEDVFLLMDIENNWTVTPMEKRPVRENYQYFLYLEKNDSIQSRVAVNMIEGYVEIREVCYFFDGSLMERLLPFAMHLEKEKYRYASILEARREWDLISKDPSLFKLNDFVPSWTKYKGQFSISYQDYSKKMAQSDAKLEIEIELAKRFPGIRIKVELFHENISLHPKQANEFWYTIKVDDPKIYKKQKLYSVLKPYKTYRNFHLTTFWKEEISVSASMVH